MMRAVVPQMAALTHRFQVLIGAIFRLMIEVRDRQHDPAFRPLCELAVTFDAPTRAGMLTMQSALAFTLALPTRAHADSRADRFPIGGIPRSLARPDRHSNFLDRDPVTRFHELFSQTVGRLCFRYLRFRVLDA